MPNVHFNYTTQQPYTTSPAVERVLARLKNARHSGDGWLARCPAHDDQHPSLSISEGDDGRVLLKCFAGCSTKAIVQALGLKMADLFPNPKPDSKSEHKSPSRLATKYEIRDVTGRLVAIHERYEKSNGKYFVWRQSTGEKGLNGIPLSQIPLFGSEKIAEWRSKPFIALCEGEKAALALQKSGIPALGTVCGAGVCPDVEVLRPLAGKRVVLWPDNDPEGHQHMCKIAEKLSDFADVRWFEWRGAPPKGDTADYIAQGGDVTALHRVLEEAPAWKPQDDEPVTSTSHAAYHLTDLGNAERFVNLFGDRARYVPAWGWLVWDGRRWAPDETNEITRLAIETVKAIYREAADCADPEERKKIADHAKRSESRQRIEAMIGLAQALVAEHPDKFDKDPYLLNVENGTLDLRTGELCEHRKEDLITKLAPVRYDTGATAPTWLAFLNRIFAGNQTLISFMQRSVGYALTGDTREQCLLILHGCGANGKSTFIVTTQGVLGDYALQTPTETLLSKRTEYIPNDIARLKGARFVSAIESAEGRKLNEPLIKQMTGGDKISARFLHREWFDFTPEFKIFWATNYKPTIRGTDHAIWRRVRLVPFTVSIPEPEQDRELPRKLAAEASGILNWAIEGCLAWQREGLGVPQEVKQATEQYRSEMDILAAFIADCCVIDPSAKIASKELYAAYEAWCRENGETPLSSVALGRQLSERGFIPTRTKRARTWQGVGLRVTDEPECVTFSDQNGETTQKVTDGDTILQVFPLNGPRMGKTRKNASPSVTQQGDFSEQNAQGDTIGANEINEGDIPF